MGWLVGFLAIMRTAALDVEALTAGRSCSQRGLAG